MTKREFDKRTSQNAEGYMTINGRAMYRIYRSKGDELPRDRLAVVWRGLVPTYHDESYLVAPSWGLAIGIVKTPTRRGAWLKTYGLRSRLPPAGAHPGDRVRYMLELRKGNYDHYIGGSGFAEWSRGATRRARIRELSVPFRLSSTQHEVINRTRLRLARMSRSLKARNVQPCEYDSGFAAWSRGVRRRWCRIAWLVLDHDRSRRICYVRSIVRNPDPDAFILPRI